MGRYYETGRVPPSTPDTLRKCPDCGACYVGSYLRTCPRCTEVGLEKQGYDLEYLYQDNPYHT